MILSGDVSQLLIQVGDTVMVLLRVLVAHELAVVATEYYRGAVRLMFKYILVRGYFLATAFPIAALKFDLGKKVSRDSIDFVELGVASAEGTVVRVLGKPVALAVRADWLLADLALQRIFKDVVAYTTNQLGQECSYISFIINKALFIVKALLVFGLNGRT